MFSKDTRDKDDLDKIIALINKHQDLDLIDAETPSLEMSSGPGQFSDPAEWLDRNRRTMLKYQSLIRTAVTLEALLDAEQSESN